MDDCVSFCSPPPPKDRYADVGGPVAPEKERESEGKTTRGGPPISRTTSERPSQQLKRASMRPDGHKQKKSAAYQKRHGMAPRGRGRGRGAAPPGEQENKKKKREQE